MANDEHVAQLKEGVGAWNEWRKQNPDIRPDLSEAYLCEANLAGANLGGADLTGCRIYGISAWGLKLEGAKQQNLAITLDYESAITVDNIEVAQFVYLLLHNEKIRNVIDTIGKKGVLLLGRFTEGRMIVLERLRDRLRTLGYVPIVFNFDKPETKDFTETVRLLANLSHFVIVDITNPRSTPLELQAAVPDYMVPFVPILEQGQDPFAMFADLQNKYDWVLKPVIGYSSVDRLIEVLEDKIIRPAEAKFNELLTRRTEQLRVRERLAVAPKPTTPTRPTDRPRQYAPPGCAQPRCCLLPQRRLPPPSRDRRVELSR